MPVNHREKRLSQLVSPVFSPVRLLQKRLGVRQFMTTGTLQNTLDKLVRQQEAATKIFNVCLREFGDRLIVAPVQQIDLQLMADVSHLEAFNM